ncbi:MAG: AAA family ATPase [Pseudomonadota bacterium]
MIDTLAISGYRSLRDVVVPLGALTVITGANGSGKSSIYRTLRLIADIADDGIIRSLAEEGGFSKVQWAGPETISAAMRRGDVPVQGTVRNAPTALKLGLSQEGVRYAIELGLPPQDGTSLFNADPEIKAETLWTGEAPRPSARIAERRGPSLKLRSDDGPMVQQAAILAPYDAMMRSVPGVGAAPELAELARSMSAWRFYDALRTDADAPVRQPQIGTRTLRLSADGSDLAAAVQTIFEVGDSDALLGAIDAAFPGCSVQVVEAGGLFTVQMSQPGMLRALSAQELSDGTLRFLLLACALLAPRPAPLLVLNEPEASLHGALIPALASLIDRARDDSQVIVVSHNRALVASLLGIDADLVELHKDLGETMVTASDLPPWTWPKR